MTVVDVRELRGKGGSNGSGGLRHSRPFLAITDDPHDTEIEILGHRDIPKRGERHPLNPYAVVDDVSAEQSDSNPYLWDVTAEYIPLPEAKELGGGSSAHEPVTLQPPSVKFDWMEIDMPVTRAALVAEPGQVENPADVGKVIATNVPITNSLGDLATDVPTEKVHIPVVELMRAEVNYDHLAMQPYMNKLNSETLNWGIGTFGPGMVWLQNITASDLEYQQEFGITYRSVTYRMAIWQDWDHPVYNLGGRGRDSSGGRIKNIQDGEIRGLTAFFDLTPGNPVFGHVSNGVVIRNPNLPIPRLRWRIKPRIDFSPLNLYIPGDLEWPMM